MSGEALQVNIGKGLLSFEMTGSQPAKPAAQQLIEPDRNELAFHPQDLDA